MRVEAGVECPGDNASVAPAPAVQGAARPQSDMVRGRFRTARAQCAHSANYYGDYPGNSPENHPPAESCTTNSNLKNSNI